MLDKTIPFFGVLMTKTDTDNYPTFELPQGYRFSGYQHGFELAWADMMFRLEQTDTLPEAHQIFHNEFLSKPELLEKQCLFVLDENGHVAATASLWHGVHFGETFPRIHYVATYPEYQGKGLVKALLTKLFNVYNELGLKDFIYLTTQTWSYKAVNIYKTFGFEPYLGEKPMNWKSDNFEIGSKQAWTLIEQKIQEYKRS